MEKIIYIYNKDLNLVAQPYVKDYEEFKEDPIKYFPDWEISMFASLEKYNNPILDETEEIREKTREELILLDNKLDLLQDGEYIEDGKINIVETPKDLIKKIWNRDLGIWKEGATKEEIIKERKNRILQYSQLKKEKDELIASGFAIQEEIDSIDIQMNLFKKDIDTLEMKIKNL